MCKDLCTLYFTAFGRGQDDYMPHRSSDVSFSSVHQDPLSQQMGSMTLFNETEAIMERRSGRMIQDNLSNLGQFGNYSVPIDRNYEKLIQELDNLEKAHQAIKQKQVTLKALYQYASMLPGPPLTLPTLEQYQVEGSLSRLNIWAALTVHLNTIASMYKQGRILKEMENDWTVETLQKYTKQLKCTLRVLREFWKNAGVAPQPNAPAECQGYSEFLSALKAHCERMTFTPKSILSLAVLFAHAKMCTKFSGYKRLTTVLHLALNQHVRCTAGAGEKAELIETFVLRGETTEKSLQEITEMVQHHYFYYCPCQYHVDLFIPPNWTSFEGDPEEWCDVEQNIRFLRAARNQDLQVIPAEAVEEELSHRLYGNIVRQLTNTFLPGMPCSKEAQHSYCKANFLTFTGEHMLMMLIRLIDATTNHTFQPSYYNKKLGLIEMANLILCNCELHKTYRTYSNYRPEVQYVWAKALPQIERKEERPLHQKLAGINQEIIIPQLWNCNNAQEGMPLFIPPHLQLASEKFMPKIRLDVPNLRLARTMWAIDMHATELVKQGQKRL